MLTTYRHGTPSDAPPLLIVHGLFGSARNWNVIAKRLGEDREVITVDMRNHGASFWDPAHDYPAMAADLAEVIEAEGKAVDLIGHSMGGKAAMALALGRPEVLSKLVVADIAPVAYGHSQKHLIQAMRSLDLSQVTTRGDADRALAGEIEEASVRAFLLQSLDVKEKAWRLNLDALEDQMPQIIGWPAPKEQFDGPVLLLSGAASDYVLPEYRDAVKTLFPNARFAKIPGAGHWLHAEKPREFEAAVAAFLNA